MNNLDLKQNDWIKESWYFHGFGSGEGNEIQEYKNKNKSFRFIQYKNWMQLDISRVNRQGWPVSDYSYEKVTEEQMKEVVDNPKFKYHPVLPNFRGLAYYTEN